MCFQSPPKGETVIEENKDASAASASEPSSQEVTPEKGKIQSLKHNYLLVP